jgi:5-methylcytosine-specific restriction endonuclease McrBC GTP-binding regulatory subunit McrB
MNYQVKFKKWLTRTSETNKVSNKIPSYLKAIELLEIPFKNKGLIVKSIFEIDDSHFIEKLYIEAKAIQKDENGYLNIKGLNSYREGGFYSASLKSYKKFLVEIMSTNTIFYGSPGTGKSYKVNEILKTIERKYYERITFHPEYDHHSFVGGYKPISEGDSIKYKFVPQVFTNIYVRAWQDLENQYYLAIEEINRGNCAEIFGDIFQLLDRKSDYDVTPSNELKTHLEEVLGADHNGIRSGLKLPPNLALLATMNTSDQSLFPMDSAFKRRWDWEYIPIDDTKSTQNASSKYVVKIDENTSFNWLDFIIEVNVKIRNNVNLGMDKCIGNYFIKPDADEISLKEFINKAIFYLWNDVFKDEEDSIFARGVHYEDFFPIETKGKAEVKKILDELKIIVSDSKSDVE